MYNYTFSVKQSFLTGRLNLILPTPQFPDYVAVLQPEVLKYYSIYYMQKIFPCPF